VQTTIDCRCSVDCGLEREDSELAEVESQAAHVYPEIPRGDGVEAKSANRSGDVGDALDVGEMHAVRRNLQLNELEQGEQACRFERDALEADVAAEIDGE